MVDGLLRGVPHFRAFGNSSPDGPGRVRQILAVKFVELGSRSSSKGREHVRRIELAPRVGPDRVRQILGVEAVQGSQTTGHRRREAALVPQAHRRVGPDDLCSQSHFSATTRP